MLQVMKPMSCYTGTKYFEELCASPEWVVEPKLDGWRCLVINSVPHSKTGNVITLGHKLILPDGIFDGEWMRGTDEIFLFDVLQLYGKMLLELPLSVRRMHLSLHAHGGNGVQIVPQYIDKKAERLQEWLETGYEGAVFKLRQSQYKPGEQPQWVKVKS